MKRSQREAAARGSTHLLRLSLPAVRSNEFFEGADILAEAAAVPAILLCQVYRGVMAWALTPAAEHEGLFPSGAGGEARRLVKESTVPREVRPAMEGICGLLDDPVGGDPQAIAEACMRIGEWADTRGDAPATALRFMQAAATCSPNDPRLAYRAGYVARRRASWDIAEMWFRHSSTVGRRNRDWDAHATAYLALGNNYYHQGRYALAKREHAKALRVSRRHGLQEIQGRAYHDLLAMAILTGDTGGAEINARKAFRAYGPRHANIPTLAHDTAYFWHEHGHFGRALRVFRALLPHFTRADRRILVLGSIGRGAGECGLRDVFEEAWSEVWQLAGQLGDAVTTVPPAMLHLAQGALRLGEWTRAESAIRHAHAVASQRGETDVLSEAERLLEATLAQAASAPVQPVSSGTAAAESEALADDFVTSLVALAGSR